MVESNIEREHKWDSVIIEYDVVFRVCHPRRFQWPRRFHFKGLNSPGLGDLSLTVLRNVGNRLPTNTEPRSKRCDRFKSLIRGWVKRKP